MTDTQRNFLGIPITGESGSPQIKQRTKEEFAQIMQPVLDDPTITHFGWTQYTPYFNEGDVREFSAHSLWVHTLPPEPEPEKPWEERFLRAVSEQFKFVYVLSADNVLKMIAEALKQVPVPDVAKVLEERDELILERHAATVGEGVAISTVYAKQVLADVLEHIDEPQAEEEEDCDGDHDYEWSVSEGGRHGLGGRKSTYDRAAQQWTTGEYEGPDEARYDRCMALNRAIQGGEFDHVLLELFGDHASIKVTKTGIEVEAYSHE
jgi:hypothetical protein